MNLYQLHARPKTLYGYERRLEIPKFAYEQAEDKYYETGLRSPELEQVIARDPYYAYIYAVGILRKRWPEGESAIAREPGQAFQYARQNNRTWKDMGKPEVESVIAQSPEWAYYYARWVMQSRWPEAEPYIRLNPVWWDEYLTHFRNQF